MRESPVIAIAVADIHLSLRPPVARSAEEDWLKAMRRQLKQLGQLPYTYRANQNAVPTPPIIYAGDIFDRHNPPPELINFAIKHLPHGWAIPGQHDLPNHRYEDLQKSAYWTLMEVGVITNIPPGEPVTVEGATPMRLWGFPFGVPVEPLTDPNDFMVEIAVVHDYFWCKGHGHEGAPEEKRLFNRAKNLRGYDVVVAGDNHDPFEFAEVFNCGSFFRRRSDERTHRPSAGLIHADGTVSRHYFDCSKDVFLEEEELAKAIMKEGDVEGLVEELSKLSDAGIDFADYLRRRVERRDVGKAVGELALEFMERER